MTGTCVNNPGYTCRFDCNEYFVPTTVSEVRCQENGEWDMDTDTLCKLDINIELFILVGTEDGEIFHIDVLSPTLQYVPLPLTGVGTPVAVDFDYVDNKVYWLDLVFDTINRASLNGNDREIILSVDIKAPERISLDVVNRKIYWTDSGTDRIDRANLDGSRRETLINTNLDKPRAIIVDSDDSFIYWSDWGESPKIERANLDGSGRLVLVSNNLRWPNGLALDKTEKKLFWCDAGIDIIEYYDLVRHSRQRLVTLSGDNAEPFDLTVLGDYLYWTQWDKNQLQRADKSTGNNVISVGHQILDTPYSIHAFSSARIQTTDIRCPMEFFSGTITDSCINKPGYTCLFQCNKNFIPTIDSGVRCQENGEWHTPTKTLCELDTNVEPFLLVGDDQSDGGKIFHINASSSTLEYVILPLADLERPVAVDFDYVDNKVYWTDVVLNTINRALLNGSDTEVIVSVNVDVPDGISLDVMNRKIYWTDTGTDRIERANLDGSDRVSLINTGLDEPRAIIVDIDDSLMYWTDWGKTAKIEKANLDGSGRQSLVSNNLLWPNGITLDKVDRKLFWCDAGTDVIEYYHLDLGTRHLLITLSDSSAHPFSLTVFDDYLYWTQWGKKQLQRADKSTGNNVISVGHEIFESPYGIHAFSSARVLTTGTVSYCHHLLLVFRNIMSVLDKIE
ncbi:low-density lipoprotein receptor-related protein 4-like [Glandiceps talaboti]